MNLRDNDDAQAVVFARLFMMNPHWTQFARPQAQDGSYTAAADLRYRSQIELITGEQPFAAETYRKPSPVAANYLNHRWRMFLPNLGLALTRI